MAIKKVLEAIAGGKVFLISSHLNLEGDSLGSEIAMGYLLRKMKKDCFIYNDSPIPQVYEFLPTLELVQTTGEKPRDFDTAVVLDCSDLNRIGKVKDLITKDKFVINIDHHIDNKNFGTINWVDVSASAVGEMIYELFQKAGVELDRDVALCLYVAILTDTGSFRFENTTPRTHIIVGHLMEYDIKPKSIFERIYESCSLSRMKLLGLALSNLKIDDSNGIAWMVVSQDMLKLAEANLEDIEGFIEMVCSIEGIKIAILFQEVEKNKVKVGFRSKGKINVSRIAQYFGGGGHFAASGCILEGKLKEVEKRVLEKVSEDITQPSKQKEIIL